MRTIAGSAGLCAVLTFITTLTPIDSQAQFLWINEFHYDNTGGDVGEFVEIIAPSSYTDLASVRLTLYNGGDGRPYGSAHLLSSFTPGESAFGYTLYSKPISGLQNGAPDGLALDRGGEVLHFISYEGSFTATVGPAVGLLASDIGVAQSESTPVGASLGLTGIGADFAAFTWAAFGVATPGAFNPGQAVVPEPHEYALTTAAGLLAFMAWRRRRARSQTNPVLANLPTAITPDTALTRHH